MAKKQVVAIVKIQIPAGQATPAPPVGTALGPHGVVHLAEVHDVHAVGPERRSDRGRGRGRAGGNLDLDDGGDALLRHFDVLSFLEP